jgi:thiol-disulfide isomerase/thioredoxin
VKGYPAVFVDGVLVAAPREFGFFGEKEGSGRYAPWRDAGSQAKFKDDLSRMIDLILAGRKDLVHAADAGAPQLGALPAVSLTDLSGRPIAPADLADHVVLVEFWATWCPPCRSTLEWLGTLKAKYGDKLAILALAVESPEAGVRSTAAALNPEVRWAITDAATARAFGDITAVPTMFVFDRAGKTARVLFGAPPDLHDEVGKLLDGLLR